MEKKARILGCKPCAATRLIAAENLPPGPASGTGVTPILLAADSQVFTFEIFRKRPWGRG